MSELPPDRHHLQRAIELAETGWREGHGGPFGAVIVRRGEVVAEAWNTVPTTPDPTAHAEIAAIRRACQAIGSHKLTDCVLYTSCEPCPMCYSAAYFAGIERIVYAATHAEAGRIAGYGMEKLYSALEKPIAERNVPSQQLLREAGLQLFEAVAAARKK